MLTLQMFEPQMSIIYGRLWQSHRHLRKIDSIMARTACLVGLISTVSGCSKKTKNALEDVGLVTGT